MKVFILKECLGSIYHVRDSAKQMEKLLKVYNINVEINDSNVCQQVTDRLLVLIYDTDDRVSDED